MAINTGLSIPVFNLTKYFALFISFDIIVRITVYKLNSYIRGYKLAHGCSVPISSTPIDRHGLTSHSLKSASFLRIVVVLLIITTYTIEIMLEFSSDSIATLTNVPGEIRALPAEEKTCGLAGISNSGTVEHMINFANECIVLDEENKKYNMYKANWEVGTRLVLPKCLKTEANVMVKGRVPFNETNWINDEPTGQYDDIPLFDQGADSRQGVQIIHVNAKDVIFTRQYWSEEHVAGSYRTSIPDSNATCFGSIFGRKGDGIIKLENSICTTSSWPVSDDTDIIFFPGTGVAYSDVAELGTATWNGSVIATSFNGVQGIRNFSRVVTHGNLFSTEAFAAFLGGTNNRDHRSLQKYAIIYENCEMVQVPNIDAKPRLETVPNATSALVVRAEVEEWALILVASWSVFLLITKFVLSVAIRRQSLPRTVQGEEDMVKLWFHEKAKVFTGSGKDSEVDCDLESNMRTDDNPVQTNGAQQPRRRRNLFNLFQTRYYLSVREGVETDDITVTTGQKRVERNTTKAFSFIK